jgi:hypothetical protein
MIFSPSFKYFKNSNELKKYKQDALERIDNYVLSLLEDENSMTYSVYKSLPTNEAIQARIIKQNSNQ